MIRVCCETRIITLGFSIDHVFTLLGLHAAISIAEQLNATFNPALGVARTPIYSMQCLNYQRH
jgi:hypothetical protein